MALENLVASALCQFVKLLTGVRPIWRGAGPADRSRVYFANHRSHGDFLLIWASLPPYLRQLTRPVAAADYWLTGRLRRYVGVRVFRSVLIERTANHTLGNPVEKMAEALNAGNSLIIFPEGTRNLGDGLLPLKSGLYHLSKRHPETEFIPVWIENLGRVMPKGSFIPAPLLCTLTFGEPLMLHPDEAKQSFLKRARDAMIALAPETD